MLANVVTNSPINLPSGFNIVSSMEEIIPNLPTLIVGYELVKGFYPDFDITEISLGDNMYWTFKKTEKRDKFEYDLKWFMSKVLLDLVSKIKYIFVDPIQYSPRQLIKIIRKIKSLRYKITFFDGKMYYIYGEDLIFGVDLSLLDYIGFDIVKINNKINGLSDVFLSGNDIIIEYNKKLIALDNKVMFIPFLYSINHEEKELISNIHNTITDK